MQITHVEKNRERSGCEPYFRSHRKLWVAFEDLHLEFWRFTMLPNAGSKLNAIENIPSIRTLTAFEGTRNANEFRLNECAGSVDHRVAVASHVDKRNMRRHVGIGQRLRFRDVSAVCVLETRAHPMF